MAWQGKITSFVQNGDFWEIGVSYYNDVNPALSFPRSLRLPLSVTKPEAVQAIQDRGAEVKRVAKLNEENFIGLTIPIP